GGRRDEVVEGMSGDEDARLLQLLVVLLPVLEVAGGLDVGAGACVDHQHVLHGGSPVWECAAWLPYMMTTIGPPSNRHTARDNFCAGISAAVAQCGGQSVHGELDAAPHLIGVLPTTVSTQQLDLQVIERF